MAKVFRAGSREIYSVRQMLSKLQHDFDPNTSMSTKRSNCQSPHTRTRTRTTHTHTHTLKETKRILSSIVIFHFASRQQQQQQQQKGLTIFMCQQE